MPTTIIDLYTDDPAIPVPAPAPPATGELIHDPNMVARSINRLISYFRRGPRNRAFLDATVGEFQILEDAAWTLYYETRLPNADGVNLDVIGRVVRELRAGRDDEDYRAALRTRILVNRSNGRIEDLIAIIESMVPGAAVTVAEYLPPTIVFNIDDLGDVTAETAYRMLFQAKAAGVRLEMAEGLPTIGSYDGTVVGGTIGSYDGTTLGFEIGTTY